VRVERLSIPDVMLLTPDRFGDSRGFFSETFVAARIEAAGITLPFVQDNHSKSGPVGVLRGLHCQLNPYAQGKLIRVVSGAIWDVAVDARQGSPSFGQHVSAELSVDNWEQMWVPPGFLHGFCTLRPDTEVIYKTTDYYDSASERGVIWDDPDLAIPWRLTGEAVLSAKDKLLPRWRDVGRLFSA